MWALLSGISFPRAPMGPKGWLHLAGVHRRERALGNGWEAAERVMVIETVRLSYLPPLPIFFSDLDHSLAECVGCEALPGDLSQVQKALSVLV